METLYITHPLCRLHDMGAGHPESPARLDAVADQLVASGLMNFLAVRTARAATPQDVLRVHDAAYLARLEQYTLARGHHALDADTVLGEHTLAAAWVAAGAGLTALDEIVRGHANTAFCAVRPPGHHARRGQAMGFCFFNNVAIAACYAMEQLGFTRVAIVDFDVHHGNGTEEAFYGDERLLMCGFYQHPFYPDLHVAGPARNRVNVPVPAGADGTVVREIVSGRWLPALRAFRPQLILLSAGFDAHREDPLGGLALTEADYAWLTQRLVEVSLESAQGRVVSFLEGGYDLSALGRSVVAHVRVLGSY